MEIKTTFSCGDRAWVYSEGGVRQLTIGQVRVEFTDSDGDPDSIFDNYKPQHKTDETYMCVETGIGSGSVYTLGKHIFVTREECEAANAEEIERRRVAAEQQRERQREYLLRQKQDAERRLAEMG